MFHIAKNFQLVLFLVERNILKLLLQSTVSKLPCNIQEILTIFKAGYNWNFCETNRKIGGMREMYLEIMKFLTNDIICKIKSLKTKIFWLEVSVYKS